jgi:outer membrane protein X
VFFILYIFAAYLIKKEILMKKFILCAFLLTLALSAFAQKGKNSLQANVLYGSKVETVGFGLTFNLTGKRDEFSPSISVYLPKNGVNVREINFDYHRLIGIKDKIKIFPILGLGITVWEGFGGEGDSTLGSNDTKFGANFGFGGRYTINEKFDAGFQLKYSAMSGSASQTVPMLTIAYKL